MAYTQDDSCRNCTRIFDRPKDRATPLYRIPDTTTPQDNRCAACLAVKTQPYRATLYGLAATLAAW